MGAVMSKRQQRTSSQVGADAPLLSATGIAARWSVTPRYVYRPIDEGKLQPIVRLGRLVRIKLETVQA